MFEVIDILLQLLGDFDPQIPYRGFAFGSH